MTPDGIGADSAHLTGGIVLDRAFTGGKKVSMSVCFVVVGAIAFVNGDCCVLLFFFLLFSCGFRLLSYIYAVSVDAVCEFLFHKLQSLLHHDILLRGLFWIHVIAVFIDKVVFWLG